MSLLLALAIVWVLGFSSLTAAAGIVFARWRRARRAPGPVEIAVRDLRENIESFTPPVTVNPWERRCWEPRPVLDMGVAAEAEQILAEAVRG